MQSPAMADTQHVKYVRKLAMCSSLTSTSTYGTVMVASRDGLLLCELNVLVSKLYTAHGYYICPLFIRVLSCCRSGMLQTMSLCYVNQDCEDNLCVMRPDRMGDIQNVPVKATNVCPRQAYLLWVNRAANYDCCMRHRQHQSMLSARPHLRLLSRLQPLHKLAQDLRRFCSSSDGLLCLLAHCIVIAAAPC